MMKYRAATFAAIAFVIAWGISGGIGYDRGRAQGLKDAPWYLQIAPKSTALVNNCRFTRVGLSNVPGEVCVIRVRWANDNGETRIIGNWFDEPPGAKQVTFMWPSQWMRP